MEGRHGSKLGEVRQRKWPPSRATGWATGLTRTQKRLATQRAAGVAREGSSSQLVPVDTFFPLAHILTFVLLMHRGLALLGTEVDLRMPCASIPTWNYRALGPGTPWQAGEGRAGPPNPWPSPLTFSFCLVTRLRRELRLRFTRVPLSLLSVFPMLSSLLRGGEFSEEGYSRPKRPFWPVLQVTPGIHLESVYLWSLYPVPPSLWS